MSNQTPQSTTQSSTILTQGTALLQRFVQYSSVGVGTFVLDLCLIYLLRTYAHFADVAAVGIAFLIAVSLNYVLSYYWVYRGTKQHLFTGYIIFTLLASTGLMLVLVGTFFVKEAFDTNLYLARSLVAGVVGTANFLINTFFNFRIIIHPQ